MRKIISAAFVSLDGVMQAPGAADEDRSGGFQHGGWLPPLFDDKVGEAVHELLVDAKPDLLLGRTTYDIFAAHWPHIAQDKAKDDANGNIGSRFDAATKYVATHRPESLTWQNSCALGPDIVSSLRALKKQDGPALVTQGSSNLIQTLLQHDLIDEIRLFVFPLVLGTGKRFFGSGSQPRTFEVTSATHSPRGAQLLCFRRAGNVTTGSFTEDAPSAAELERRRAQSQRMS